MIKELEHRGRREPQRTQRKNEIQNHDTLSVCERSGLPAQIGTGPCPSHQLSFPCVLCGISVPSVFPLFQSLLVHR
jgi:hypothetical protein